jgi:hypothetical protein
MCELKLHLLIYTFLTLLLRTDAFNSRDTCNRLTTVNIFESQISRVRTVLSQAKTTSWTWLKSKKLMDVRSSNVSTMHLKILEQ